MRLANHRMAAENAGMITNHPRNPAGSCRFVWVTSGRYRLYATFLLLAIPLLGCTGSPQPSERPATLPASSSRKITVSRPADYRIASQPWGQLTWFVSAEQGNCDSMTVGEATLKPGMESARHIHPNCDEVLHVIKGTIMHSLEDGKQVRMSAGDTITIPMGIAHNARNIGTEDAVMIISFSSAHRKVVNE
jgi:quercetin dioxygenase-like cupin family protein